MTPQISTEPERLPVRRGDPGPTILDESGQILPWMVMLMMLFLGFTSLVVDLGRGMLVRRQLQASTDSAALAAARTLPNSNFSTVAMQYSSAVGSLNQNGAFTVDSISIQGKCLTTVSSWGNPCTSTSPNAVSVIESATIPTFFARVVGIKTLKVSAMSTASRGANPQPYNVAIILDTTPSMNTNDSNCGASQLQCASNAVQQLLQGLAPSLDSVSLFTFPNVTSTSVSNDYDCQSSNPTTGPYTFPSTTSKSLSTMNYKNGFSTVQMTYQILGFSGDYRSSDKSTTLSTTSNLSKAVGGKSNCTGIQTSNENTYYAGAIYAAQSALLAQQAANKGTQNVIILLSDGNATGKEQNPGGAWSAGSNDFATGIQSTTIADNSGNYPSWVGQCGQGIDAAHYASNYPNNPTTVYTIAYGSLTTSQADVYNRFGQLTQSGNCASDVNAGKHQNVSPCQAMQQMSSGWSTGDKSHFYSDYYVTGGDSGCQAGDQNNTTTSLNNIFKSILVNLTAARLIPNETP